MKKLILAALGLAAIFVGAVHAQSVTVTQQTNFYRFQADIATGTSGAATAAQAQAYWQTVIRDGSGNVIATNLSPAVSWDAVAKAATTVTANGKTYTYGEILAAVEAIAEQEKTTQAAAASSGSSSGTSTTSTSTTSGSP